MCSISCVVSIAHFQSKIQIVQDLFGSPAHEVMVEVATIHSSSAAAAKIRALRSMVEMYEAWSMCDFLSRHLPARKQGEAMVFLERGCGRRPLLPSPLWPTFQRGRRRMSTAMTIPSGTIPARFVRLAPGVPQEQPNDESAGTELHEPEPP
jgi:hypothetical protein